MRPSLQDPWRGPGPGRPAGVALPPARLGMARGGRLLKRWRWVGFFSSDLMGCVGSARIGPVQQSWWAIWDREGRRLLQRTRRRRGGIAMTPGSVRVSDPEASIDLTLDEGEGVETVTPYGRGYAWTRKQGGVPVRGIVKLHDVEHSVKARAVVDDSAGYHQRHTAWRWSAGVGSTPDGHDVAWNLVDGIHDSERDSERTLWVAGEPQEVARVRFEPGLRGIEFEGGESLRFSAEATRRHSENLLLFRSEYEQPFGSFEGTLPGGLELAEGLGVMERHDVRW